MFKILAPPLPPAASPTARPPGPCRRRLPEAMGGASGRPPSHISTHWPAVADRAKGYSCCVSNARSDHVSRGGLLGSVFVLGVPGEKSSRRLRPSPLQVSPSCFLRASPCTTCGLVGQEAWEVRALLELGSRGCGGVAAGVMLLA